MSDFKRGRRRLLRSAAAWVSGMAAVAVARSAGAWQVEGIDPKSRLGLALAKRCGDPPDHATLIAQLQAELAKDPSAAPLTATCPICGCPVTVGR